MKLPKQTRAAIEHQISQLTRALSLIESESITVTMSDSMATTTRHFTRNRPAEHTPPDNRDPNLDLPMHLCPISKSAWYPVALLQYSIHEMGRMLQSDDLSRAKQNNNHPEER
jgi:hypothetical protein